MRLSTCHEPVLNKLLSISGDSQKIAKFSFVEFGIIDPSDIYLLGLRFHHGIEVAVDLDIALNCYQYAHTGYEDTFTYDFDGINFDNIHSPTNGTSLLNHVLLNKEIRSINPSYLTDTETGDWYEVEQLALLSAAVLKYQQKWALPYLDEIKKMNEPTEPDEEMSDLSTHFFSSNFNALLSKATRWQLTCNLPATKK